MTGADARESESVMKRVLAALSIWTLALVASVVAILLPGCGGDARVELAAADALDVAASEFRVTLNEYHRDLAATDDMREANVVAAFVRRIRTDAADEAKSDVHAEQFATALARIRADRAVAAQRYAAGVSQADAVVEVARGLRRIGIESLTLQDEMRRYLSSYIDAMKRAKAAAAAGQTGGVRVPTNTQPASQPAWMPSGLGEALGGLISGGGGGSGGRETNTCPISEAVNRILGQ